MNQNFKKPKSSPSALPVIAIYAFAAAALVFTGNAWADEPAEEETENGESVRFEETLDLVDDRSEIVFRVYQPADNSRGQWQFTATSRNQPDSTVCRISLPTEAGEDYYDYNLRHLQTDQGGHIVLLDVEAPQGEGPLDPTVYQVAYHLMPRTGSSEWSCSVIGRGEYSQLDGGPKLVVEEIDDSPTLTRHDVRDQLNFCGIRPEEDERFDVFDTETRRFVPSAPLKIDDEDADELTAQIPDEPISAPLTDSFYSWLMASSDIRGAPSGAAVPRPIALGNLDLTSAWVAGGESTGEFVTAGINTAAPLRGLRIFPGHGQSQERFEAQGYPTKLLLGLEEGQRFVVDVPQVSFEELSDRGGLFIELPEPVTTGCLSVMIVDAEAGSLAEADDADQRRMGEAAAISELTPLSTLDADTEEETAERIVAALGKESSVEQRDQISRLGQLIPSAMVDAIADVLSDDDVTIRMRTIPLLGFLPHEMALPVLESHFHHISADDEDYRHTKRAIASHGSLAAPTLLEILNDIGNRNTRKYVDTVRLIGRLGSDIHLIRLISNLGDGGDLLRRERIRAIANGGISVVPRLLDRAESEGDNEAGLDALTTLVFIGQRHFSDEQAKIDDAHDLSEVYRESESRPHRLRAIEALGYYYHSEAESLLGDELLGDNPDPVIRKFAAAALQLYPDAGAREYMEGALSDSSPDVRIAAIRGLNRRDDSDESTDAVIAYAAAETWPRGLHHAMQLLANSTHPNALPAVGDIIDDDITAPAARTALRALRHAERALPTEQIKTHLDEEATPEAIKEQLVQMLGFVDSEDSQSILIAIADGEYAPLSEQPSKFVDELAGHALLSLGKSTTEEAMYFLLAVVDDDSRTMRDRANALRGLAFFAEPVLVNELQAMAPRIPRNLRDRFRQTQRMVQNRVGIDDTGEDLQHFIDRLDEEDED